MDYYEGSVPLGFIPFYLENQMAENANVPTSSQVIESEKIVAADNSSEKTDASDSTPAPPLLPDFSPCSQDSEQDVTAYAEFVVEKIEQAEHAGRLIAELSSTDVPGQDRSLPDPIIADLTQGVERSSTRIPVPGCGNTVANLSGLESVLDVATTFSSLLPELRLASHSAVQPQEQAPGPADEDTTSSVQDALALPSRQLKVLFPPSQSGIDSSAEDTSQFDVFELYGQIPVDMESGTDGGIESGFCTRRQGPEETRI